VAELTSSAKAERMLLRLVRALQPISRVELARRLGLNRSTVTEIFKPLIAEGIVREERAQATSNTNRAQGRPPMSLSFCSEREMFIGVNIGVRRSQVGLASLGEGILAEEDFDTPVEPALALAEIRACIERLCAQVPVRKLKVIGVS